MAVVGCSGGSSGQGTTDTQDPDPSAGGEMGGETGGEPSDSPEESVGSEPIGSATPATGAASGTVLQAAIARRVFDPRLVGFDVRVFYERGAEPYTGALGLTSNDTWDITRESYRDLFAAHSERSVPSTSPLG